MTRIFAAIFLAILMFGCATLGNVVTACKPSTTDEQQAIMDLFERPDLTTAEVIATAEAGKIAICAISEIAKDMLNQASKIKLSAQAESPLVIRANAWLAKHP